jgi:phytoene synthase
MPPASPAENVPAAYRYCEQVTRTQARNFAYGIALLPGPRRRALSAVYALARRIDDIGDGTLAAPEKLSALQAERAWLAALISAVHGTATPEPDTGSDPVFIALADAASRFPIPLGAFGELIDGCEADVRGRAYASFAELEHYCRCVAGSIGRLSLGVFGCGQRRAAEPLADALGIALQLTNILRDIREDAEAGRVYLPADDLACFGCSITPGKPASLPASSGLAGLIRFEAQRARQWYARGMRLLPLLDRRSAACTAAMAGIYARLLEHIAAHPELVLRQRVSLSAREKAKVAALSLTRAVLRQNLHAGNGVRAPGAGVPALADPPVTETARKAAS